jgi:hypothetical protein
MRYGSECAIGGLGAVVALGILIAALEVSVAAIPVPRGVDPASVDRTLKRDRLSPIPGTNRASPALAPVPKLPDGCIAASEWRRAKIYSDEIAGRCVA